MGEEIKLLEYHAHFAGDTAYLVLIYILRSRGGFGAQGFAINDNAALVNGFQLI